jgi:hypothetical protein
MKTEPSEVCGRTSASYSASARPTSVGSGIPSSRALASNDDPAGAPVDVAQLQPRHLDRAQPQPRDQQQNRMVADLDRIPVIAVVQQQRHVACGQRLGNARLTPSATGGIVVVNKRGAIGIARRSRLHTFEQHAANLFFQLVSSRYEHASLILTSNLPFSRWGDVFSDHVAAAAMIDRIVHDADVLTLKGNSYRLRNNEINTLPSMRTDNTAD